MSSAPPVARGSRMRLLLAAFAVVGCVGMYQYAGALHGSARGASSLSDPAQWVQQGLGHMVLASSEGGPLPSPPPNTTLAVKHLVDLLPVGEGGDKYAFDVSIVAVVKMEASYIVEWLEYHMLLGVQFFVLISNDCQDADWQVLSAAVRPYVLAGEVHLEDMYRCATEFQLGAYRVAYRAMNMAHTSKWIGFMDGDEFFVTEDLRGTIPGLLARFEGEDVAAVAFNRLCFGPGGHKSRPRGSVVASYLRHINPFTRFHERPVQYFVKMFVRAHACADLRVHGCARAGNGTDPAVTPLGAVNSYYDLRRNIGETQDGLMVPPKPLYTYHGGWLNHYYTKSEEELALKNQRGDAHFLTGRPIQVVPNGTLEVLSTHIIRSLWSRLYALREAPLGTPQAASDSGALETPAQLADRLEGLLLAGAPTLDQMVDAEEAANQEIVVSAPGSGVWKRYPDWAPVWSPSFVSKGEAFVVAVNAAVNGDLIRARVRRQEMRAKGLLPPWNGPKRNSTTGAGPEAGTVPSPQLQAAA